MAGKYLRTRVPTAESQGMHLTREEASKKCIEVAKRLVGKIEETGKIGWTDPDFKMTNAHAGVLRDAPKAEVRLLRFSTLKEKKSLRYADCEFFKGTPEPDVPMQGAAADCWFIATVSAICAVPDMIQRLCVFQNQDVGVFGFVFHSRLGWKYQLVSDSIPFICVNGRTQPMGLSSRQGEIWVALLEKAYAKHIGGYDKLVGNYTGHAFQDLTGQLHYVAWPQFHPYNTLEDVTQTERLWKVLVGAGTRYFVTCSTGVPEDLGDIEGLANNHAYAVLGAREVLGTSQVLVRDPNRSCKWRGLYEKFDATQTAGQITFNMNMFERTQADFRKVGPFWIPFGNFISVFDSVSWTDIPTKEREPVRSICERTCFRVPEVPGPAGSWRCVHHDFDVRLERQQELEIQAFQIRPEWDGSGERLRPTFDVSCFEVWPKGSSEVSFSSRMAPQEGGG